MESSKIPLIMYLKKKHLPSGRKEKNCCWADADARFFVVSASAIQTLSFPDELLIAPGAGDGNLALAPGDTNGLVALGAVKVPVLAILDPLTDLQETPVFLIAGIDIPGKTAANGPDHQAVADDPEDQVKGPGRDHHGQQTGHQSGAQHHHIQPIRTVPACHKIAVSAGSLCRELPKPSIKSSHIKNHLFVWATPAFSPCVPMLFTLLYCKNTGFQLARLIVYGLFKNYLTPDFPVFPLGERKKM